jgi:hypothetical protein
MAFFARAVPGGDLLFRETKAKLLRQLLRNIATPLRV